MKFFLGVLFIVLQIPFVNGEIKCLGSRTATNYDYRQIAYPVVGQAIKLENWRAISGDKQYYSKADINDSNWKKVEVGKGIISQGINGKWCWYRVNFNLPDSWQGYQLILDIGRISAYGEIYLNGVKCGSSGTPPPNLTFGCSKVYWKYILQPELLKKGKNLLAFRVYLGFKGGLFDGAYTLSRLLPNTVCVRFPLKNTAIPSESLSNLLTDAVHLNRFKLGSDISLTPELLNLDKTTHKGILSVELVCIDGTVKAGESTELVLAPGEWQKVLVKMPVPSKTGKYFCLLRYSDGKKKFIDKKIALEVVSAIIEKDFSIPVNTSISNIGAFPVKVTPGPLGRFGPRLGSREHQLRDNTERTDSRSGMCYSVQIKRKNNGPKLFLSNVRPVPENLKRVERFHLAPGHKFDGVADAWIYGYVCPNRAGDAKNLDVKNINWVGRTYHYRYANGNYMDFTVNAINPAWMLESDCLKLRVFDKIRKHGIDVPRYLAYESKGKIKVVEAAKGIKGADMSANWVLAWFSGGKNWEEFDSPYFFVVEKRLNSIKTINNAALFFISNDSVGKIQGMPLYGVTLLKPSETKSWVGGLPEKVVKRCRFWSRVLAVPPIGIKRSASVDYKKDRLLMKDEVEYGAWSDAWNTKGMKIVPVSTIMPLAAASGNMKISVNHPVTDLHMATLQGPLVAAENTDVLAYAFDGLLHYLREVRVVEPGESSQIKELKNDFNKLLERGYIKDLTKIPWEEFYHHGKFMPGCFRNDYTNLLLSRIWMKPELRAKVDRAINDVSEKYLLYSGMPDSSMQAFLKPQYKDIPAVTVLTNPVTGIKLAVAPMVKENTGIDSVYFSNLNIYMAWLYAYTYQRQAWLKEHYELLKEYFNSARNSHDWGILASWDTFSGIRVGNGLQESGGIYAGALAMARIARSLNDSKNSDLAAYHAVMQLVSMQGSLTASEYLKRYRPWPATHSHAAEIEYTQKIRKAYFAELNELAGLSQLLIGTKNSASSPGGYIESPLPEVMRPYQEIWRKFTDDFYDPRIDIIIKMDRRLDDRASVDTFFYQTKRSPGELKNIFEMRSKLSYSWWTGMADYRGYLDSLSTIKYHKLW